MEPGFFPTWPWVVPEEGWLVLGLEVWPSSSHPSGHRGSGSIGTRGLAVSPHWAHREDVRDLKPCRFMLP